MSDKIFDILLAGSILKKNYEDKYLSIIYNIKQRHLYSYTLLQDQEKFVSIVIYIST